MDLYDEGKNRKPPFGRVLFTGQNEKPRNSEKKIQTELERIKNGRFDSRTKFPYGWRFKD